ncbi:MAG: TRAP transporter large permease subunit [Burkholderiaceae bacterium]|nr:TRAP transporter large permease subunit [Burkholderiaceae bacterium]
MWASFKTAIWALVMPVLILVGFRMGVFTATEIAGIICAYAFGIGILIYRTLGIDATKRGLLSTAKDTAALLMLVGGAAPLAWILGIEGAPQIISDSLQAATSNPWMVLLLLNGVLLLMGLVMETLALLIILVPILAPVLEGYGVNMIHFGIILLVNLTIGQQTPPIGILGFVASSISKVPPRQLFVEVLPFLAALIGMLLLFTFVPAISLWLPNLMM